MAFLRSPRVVCFAIIWLLLLQVPGDLHGQNCGDFWGCAAPPPVPPRRTWQGEVLTLAANALLGGSTAAIRQKFQGGSFGEGLYKGSVGGSVSYLGKRISGERFDGAGFLGRQVAAVGASMVVNSSEGRGLLDRVVLPIGPLRLYIDSDEDSLVRAKADLPGVVLVGYAVMQGMSFDWRTSLSAGTPVFNGLRRPFSAGSQVAGIVLMRENDRIVLAHEQVHIGQYDFSFIAWGEPIERALWGGRDFGARGGRYVDVGLHLAMWAGLDAVLGYSQRPWEWEAQFLSNTRSDFK